MEIRKIYNVIARKWWLVALFILLGGGLGFLSTVFMMPLYQADTTLYIMNRSKVLSSGESLNPQDIEVSRQLVLQYTDIISSPSVTSGVLAEVADDNITTEKELLSMVSITTKKDSSILIISAVGSDPTVAAKVANAMGREFINQIHVITNSNNVGILDKAKVPVLPISNTTKKVLLGVLAGLIVILGATYITEHYDTTVRSAEDVESILDWHVIGIIPEHDIH